jgi:hypothetical protein
MTPELILIALSLPILFALHNLEEVIVYEYFMRKNRAKFQKRLPKFLATKITKIAGGHTTASFALGITILTLIFTAISYLAIWQNSHFFWLIWLATTLVFLAQLIVHVVSAIIWRGYAFGTITAIIFLPIFIIMISNFLPLMTFSWPEIIAAFLVIYVVGYVGGIAFLHGWLMKKFDKKFSEKEVKK